MRPPVILSPRKRKTHRGIRSIAARHRRLGLTAMSEARVLSGDTADRNLNVSKDVDRESFDIVHVHVAQDVDSFLVGGVNRNRTVDHVDACEDSIGKQTLRNDYGNADASLPSHESTSSPFAFPCANCRLEESHSDAIHFDQALGQSELPPVASVDTHLSMFHLNPQGINTEAKRKASTF